MFKAAPLIGAGDTEQYAGEYMTATGAKGCQHVMGVKPPLKQRCQ